MNDSARIVAPHIFEGDWLSASELREITPQVLADRVRSLLPLIEANAQQAEQQRFPVDEVIAALRKSGVFYHFVPKQFGGLEFGIVDFVNICLPLGEACMSTAWVTSFYVQHNFLACQLPAQGQAEVFGSRPYTTAPGTAAPPATATSVDGGYRVSGRIKYASGVMHGDWVQIVANAERPDGDPMMLYCMLPIEEVTVLDTWFVDGLAGTGSNDIVLDDVFIPEHRTVDFEEMRAGRGAGGKLHENLIYRAPVDVLLNISSSMPAIATARKSVADFSDQIKKKASLGPTGERVIKLASQVRLAEAELDVYTAEMLLRLAAEETERLTLNGHEFTGEERIRIRSRIAHAVHLSRKAVQTIFEGSGSSAHLLDNPLQRRVRDVSMLASHAVYDRDASLELWGKVLSLAASADTFKHHSAGQVNPARSDDS